MNKGAFIIYLTASLFLSLFGFNIFGMAAEKHPVIYVPHDTYEFETVPAGQAVLHDFMVQNTGDAPLIIEEVESDCGCTAVDFSKRIPPKGAGKVSVQLNTIDYGGNFITKYVEIFSNDPKKPVTSLIIKGTVDKFIKEAEPIFARLKGIAGEKIETEVNLTPTKKYPFKIVKLKTQKENNIDVILNRSDGVTDRIKYMIKIENLRSTSGRYHDLILAETDSPIRPELKIFVYGEIRKEK